MNNLPYRPGVGMMMLNSERKVFVAKRIDTVSEAWQMPQGGLDDGENPRTAALRELEEEIGTRNVEIITESQDWLHYDLPEDLIPKLWGGKYRGQRQKWFLMHFTGSDTDIHIDTAHPEFSQWKWIDPPELPDIIVPFKRDLYQQILKRFADFIFPNETKYY